MADQLDLFAAPAPPPAPACGAHDARHICADCSPRAATAATGFIHLGDCGGKLPLRRCKGCGQLRTPGRWNHRDWYHCLDCYPLGTISEYGRLRAP